MSLLEFFGLILLEVILTLIAGIPKLEFFYLCFSFSNLFLNFFGNLCIIEKICGLKLLGFWLRFLDFKIFYDSILGLYFSCGHLGKAIILLNLVVYFLNIISRLEVYFSFNFNHFLDSHILNVKFLIFLFYLSLYEEVIIFLKKFNKVEVF